MMRTTYGSIHEKKPSDEDIHACGDVGAVPASSFSSQKMSSMLILLGALIVVVMAAGTAFAFHGTFLHPRTSLSLFRLVDDDADFSLSATSPDAENQEVPLIESEPSVLSSRGQGVKAVRDDIDMFLMGVADPYDPIYNPDGYLVMLVAENKLMWKEMARKIQDVQANNPLPEWIFRYGAAGGQSDFVEAMAKVFRRWIEAPVDPKYVRALDGAGSVLAQLSYLLADPGDGVLVTGPEYPAFEGDFGLFGGAKLHIAPTQVGRRYSPTVEELERVYSESKNDGHPPKILIICQPNNPTGVLYSAEAMQLMVEWALEKELHIISDEIYALSVFPGYETTSAADIMWKIKSGVIKDDEKYLGNRVHIVAGLSKDWGMSGFRVGTLFTHNAQLLNGIDLLGYYADVSQYTQNALTKVFEDNDWVSMYIRENQRRLYETYKALEAALDRIDVSIVPSQGALFAWADFSSLLKEGQTEKELWIELASDAKLMFTTGSSCAGEKEGLFRIVYPWPEGGPVAMEELGNRLVKWKSERE